MATPEIEHFLKECEKSGDSAYNALKSVLEKLENPNTRTDARIFLAKLQRRFLSKEESDRFFQTFHFRIHDVLLSDFQVSISWELMITFSSFAGTGC
ncbi:hypothetical protein ACLOJK_014120 [Asimina triloba]